MAKTCGVKMKSKKNDKVTLSKLKAPHVNVPDLRIDVNLVDFGYQIDIHVDGKEFASVCRDFGGTYDVEDLRDELYQKFIKAIKSWEKNK